MMHTDNEIWDVVYGIGLMFPPVNLSDPVTINVGISNLLGLHTEYYNYEVYHFSEYHTVMAPFVHPNGY